MDVHELAWAAGFFDGEGWAGWVRNRGRRRAMAQINQAADDAAPGSLERFRRAVGGIGSIGGPVQIRGRHDLYRWTASSHGDVASVLSRLGPWLGQVKLEQLSAAAQAVSPSPSTPDGDESWLAWAAGLYDGEGCSALLHHRTHAGYMVPELSVTQSSPASRPEVLVRFLRILGAGSISGPYSQRRATMAVYRWKASARADAERVLAQLWPFLGDVKRAQAQRVLDTLAAQPPLPRGNPAWGRDKTHCIHGHEYANARLRPYASRGVGVARRVNSLCLVCLREYARRQREAKRSAAVPDRRSLEDRSLRYDYLLK